VGMSEPSRGRLSLVGVRAGWRGCTGRLNAPLTGPISPRPRTLAASNGDGGGTITSVAALDHGLRWPEDDWGVASCR
jgi:hypothetical protein